MGKWLKTLMTGGVIGGILGVLFSPDKGEKNREKLNEAIKKGKEKFEEIKGSFEKKE